MKSKYEHNTVKPSGGVDAILEQFGTMLVQKLESIDSNYKQPWFNVGGCGAPQNINGRHYNNQNAVILLFLCEFNEYKTPVFLTFNQAKEEGVKINKGSSSFPVFLTIPVKAYDRVTGDEIEISEYNKLSEERKCNYKVIYGHKSFRVFNLDQTNIAEVKPEKWQAILNKFTPSMINTSDQYKNPILDKMLQERSWVCPIQVKESNQAAYSLTNDYIVLPKQEQFIKGESFYTTLLHEMAHSTGTKGRLDRAGFYERDKHNYGREELVAELTAALSGIRVGVSANIMEENLKYIKKWCENIKEDPKFIMTVLSDVNRAQKFVETELGIVRVEELVPIVNDVKVSSTYSESNIVQVKKPILKQVPRLPLMDFEQGSIAANVIVSNADSSMSLSHGTIQKSNTLKSIESKCLDKSHVKSYNVINKNL